MSFYTISYVLEFIVCDEKELSKAFEIALGSLKLVKLKSGKNNNRPYHL